MMLQSRFGGHFLLRRFTKMQQSLVPCSDTYQISLIVIALPNYKIRRTRQLFPLRVHVLGTSVVSL